MTFAKGADWMNVSGTIMNYYFHCKRQCWLFANRINMEDNSEDVRIGRIIHELKLKDDKNTEIMIENIRVDKLTKEYLEELKKSDADIEAVKWQTLYYLKVLKDKGIERKGKIVFHEKRKQEQKTIYLELTAEIEKQLLKIIAEVEDYISGPIPETATMEKKCRRCAYYEYCFI